MEEREVRILNIHILRESFKLLNGFLIDAYRSYFLIYYVSLCLLLAVFRPFIYLKWLLIFVIFPNHYMSLCSFPFILLLLMVLIEHCRSFYSSPF